MGLPVGRCPAAAVFDGRMAHDRLCTAAAASGWVVQVRLLCQTVQPRGFP